MFRCPTCVTVLTDPSARRCQTCRQRIRRRPRVLGEERRLGVRLLPIDRALNERLHNGNYGPVRKRRMPHGDPWEGRFQVPPPAAPVDGPPIDVFVPAAPSRQPALPPLPVEPGPLDPDVQALVDDLYRRARAEMSGNDDAPGDDAAAVASVEVRPVRRRGWVAAALIDRERAGGTGGLDGLGVDGLGA